MGLSRKKSLWKNLSASLAVLETKTIDSIPFTEISAVKYVIRSKGGGKVSLLEMIVSKYNGGISDAVYSKLGDFLDVNYNVLVQGSDVILQAINNESFVIEVSVKKLTI